MSPILIHAMTMAAMHKDLMYSIDKSINSKKWYEKHTTRKAGIKRRKNKRGRK